MDPSDPHLPAAPGWFGKLACLGDFAERRLPRGFVEFADAWLSAGMSTGRARLGDSWLERYLTAPLWCFAWAPGIVDNGWWFGVMMPSADNVGRYFPLLVASRRPEAPQDGTALHHLEAWFDHLADAATATLDDGVTVDAFEQALGRAPPWPAADRSATFHPAAADAGHPAASSTGAGLHRWLHAAAVDALGARFAGCSIWWHAKPGGVASSPSIVRGLPGPAAFTDFWPGV